MKNIKLHSERRAIPELILALSAPYKSYKIAWEINRILSIALSQDVDYVTDDGSDFRVYSQNNDNDCYIKLVSNIGESGGLISSKYRNIDYFMVVSDDDYIVEIKKAKMALQKSEFIKGVFEIKPDRAIKAMLKIL